jgi:hypothetical protein
MWGVNAILRLAMKMHPLILYPGKTCKRRTRPDKEVAQYETNMDLHGFTPDAFCDDRRSL